MKDKSLPTIITVCGDPGGASAVGPVVKLLKSENRVQVLNLAYNEAAVIWNDLSISYKKLPINYSLDEISNLLRQPQIKLLFTGTSVNPIDLEKKFITVAKKFELPSLSLLDFWLNYTWRFSDADGKLVYTPDKIAVMDELARDEMIRDGFDPTKLVITGQPTFDDLADWRARFTPEIRKDIRESIGIKPDELFVLFPSQPQTSLYGDDKANQNHIGFDEWIVLEALIQSLEKIKSNTSANIHLVVRPHPRESVEMFSNIASDIISMSVTRTGGARNQVMAADLIVGMNTELLVEACYLGCITLSLQPGLRHPDRLPTNRVGVSRAVYRHEDIKPVLQEVLLDEATRQNMKGKLKNYKLESKAAANVAQLIYNMISD